MEPVSPPPKGYDFFFLELPHFLKRGGGTGQAWTFFFLLWSNAAAIPQGASVLRDQICCIWSLSIDLGGQCLGGLGREGALQYSHVGQENPNSESGLPFPRKKGSGSQEHPGRHGWSQLTIDGYKDPRPEPAAGAGTRLCTHWTPASRSHTLDCSLSSLLTGDGASEGWSSG